MTSTLSFRRESIQRSSRASETLTQAQAVQGPQAGRDGRGPTVITTSITITQ
jgi:hypothetical protein